MIGIHLDGGLGNQMFQYATARALSLRHKTTLFIDQSRYTKPDNPSNRFYALDRFNIAPSLKKNDGNPLSLEFEVSSFDLDPNILNLPDNVYLYGYWQFEGYFSDFEKEIRRDFTLKNPISDLSRAWANRIQNDPMPISIHIRRTDYLIGIATQIFHQIPLSYYKRCVGILRENFPEISLYIFSDDLNWCRENLNFGVPTYFVDGNDDSRSHEDMFLMSLCRHHIIANSSFSFWGAYLDNRIGSLIFAPKKIFITDEAEHAFTRYTSHWIILDY